MMKVWTGLLGMMLVAGLAVTGCRTVDSAVMAEDLHEEGPVVFARAQDYALIGSRSARAYFEVAYCTFSRNEAGQPVVDVGLRYRGGQSWTNWFDEVPKEVELTAVCNFYRTRGAQAEGPIVYATNTQRLRFTLGHTTAFKAVCPLKDVEGFQVVLGQ